ncbi:hypothetical protein BHM03_00017040 [Ensete ventricosum]|nr:hypothetical protein BHM03_00017040 [Ensete ventricosum]
MAALGGGDCCYRRLGGSDGGAQGRCERAGDRMARKQGLAMQLEGDDGGWRWLLWQCMADTEIVGEDKERRRLWQTRQQRVARV